MNELTQPENKFSRPFQCIPLEDAFSMMPYAFTLSPKRGHFSAPYEKNEKNVANWLLYNLHELQTRLSYSIFSDLRVEASPTGRLHLHGYIQMIDPMFFYTHDLIVLQDIGTYAIKLIRNKTLWDDYISKQDAYFMKYFKRHIAGRFEYPVNLYCDRGAKLQDEIICANIKYRLKKEKKDIENFFNLKSNIDNIDLDKL